MTHYIVLCGIVASLATCLAAASVSAAEREFVYVQKTGTFSLDGKELGHGYSGYGEGKNNPAMQSVRNVGPIPAGLWKIGPPRQYKGMDDCFDLAPIGHDALGRSDFLIHGDHHKIYGTSSRGCIVLDHAVRKKITESGITRLRVVSQ